MAERAMDVEQDLRQKEIARRLLWGQPHSEIISDLRLTLRQFQHAISSPEFQAVKHQLERELYGELDTRHKEKLTLVQEKAQAVAGEAIDTLIGLMRASASQQLQRECANDVIEYSGLAERQKKQQAPTIRIENAQLNLIMQAMREDDGRNGDPVR